AVRQIEIGLVSMLSLSSGLTAIVYGVALLLDHMYPRWVGGLAIMGGFPTMVAGMVLAYTGFSGLAMAINMPSNSLLLVWMVILGGYMWRGGGGRRDVSTALRSKKRQPGRRRRGGGGPRGE